MTQPQKNTVLVFAIVAGLASLPLTWMTIRAAQFEGGVGGILNAALGGMTLDVTGLNGHVTFLVETPIWLIVAVAIGANVLQLMRHSAMFAIPAWAEWLTALVATAWVSVAVFIAWFSDQATLGVGTLLGLFCAMAPLLCLAISTPAQEAKPHAAGSMPEER